MIDKIHTKDFLALELLKADLPEMSVKAAAGYYHDYLSPLAMPGIQLANDLDAAGTPAALALRERHFRGEFDASKAESDEWAASPEGREALMGLMPKGETP